MRHTELSEGISVLDDKGNVVGTSKLAAGMWVWILLQVWGERLLAAFVQSYCEFWSDKCIFVQALMETSLTRVVLPMPVLLLPPLIMAMLERSDEFLWIWHFRLELFTAPSHSLPQKSHTNVHLVYLYFTVWCDHNFLCIILTISKYDSGIIVVHAICYIQCFLNLCNLNMLRIKWWHTMIGYEIYQWIIA